MSTDTLIEVGHRVLGQTHCRAAGCPNKLPQGSRYGACAACRQKARDARVAALKKPKAAKAPPAPKPSAVPEPPPAPTVNPDTPFSVVLDSLEGRITLNGFPLIALHGSSRHRERLAQIAVQLDGMRTELLAWREYGRRMARHLANVPDPPGVSGD